MKDTMKETDCRKCCVCAFKESLCEGDFCERYYREGSEKDFEKLLPHWIPCSERLPEESGLYLVTGGLSGTEVCSRYYNVRDDGGFWSGHPYDAVIAWMPLPEPYEERRTDDQQRNIL